MKFQLSVIFLLFLLGGCRLYHDVLEPDSIKERGIQATKKSEVITRNEVKAVVTATYLNLFDAVKYNKDESFAVGVYISETKSTKESVLEGGMVKLFGNGIAPKEIIKLSNDDELLKSVPVNNRWSSYYLVRFQRDDKKSFKLDFSFEGYGDTSLEFTKEY